MQAGRAAAAGGGGQERAGCRHRADDAAPAPGRPPPPLAQALQQKCGEIEALLARLGDANDSMRSALSGGADARSHTLARHRDILHDYQQVWGRGGRGHWAGPGAC